MDPYGTAALKPSEWCGRVWGCLHSVVIVTPSTLWGESQRSPMHHRQGTGLAHDVVPRCFCWPRSSPRQETAPKRFSLWRSAENKQQIWMHPLRKRSRTCRGEVRSLTPTILFMASSLSDSLLLSNISLRSSFLWINNTVTDTWCGQYEKKKTPTETAWVSSCCLTTRLGTLRVCHICVGFTDKGDESGLQLIKKPVKHHHHHHHHCLHLARPAPCFHGNAPSQQ